MQNIWRPDNSEILIVVFYPTIICSTASVTIWQSQYIGSIKIQHGINRNDISNISLAHVMRDSSLRVISGSQLVSTTSYGSTINSDDSSVIVWDVNWKWNQLNQMEPNFEIHSRKIELNSGQWLTKLIESIAVLGRHKDHHYSLPRWRDRHVMLISAGTSIRSQQCVPTSENDCPRSPWPCQDT